MLAVIPSHYSNHLVAYTLAFVCMGLPVLFLFWLLNKGLWGQAAIAAGVGLGLLIIIRTRILQKGNGVIVTSERFVNVDRQGLWHEELHTVEFHESKNISVRRSGVGGMFFGFSTLHVEPADKPFVLEIPFVRGADELLSTIEQYRTEAEPEEEPVEMTLDDIVDLLPDLSDADLITLETRVAQILDERQETG